MKRFHIKGKTYIYDKASGKMVEKPKPEPIEGDPASGQNDEMRRGDGLELSHSHGPWHTWEELRAIADAVYPKTVDELQKALLEEAKKLSPDNKKEERSLGTAPANAYEKTE